MHLQPTRLSFGEIIQQYPYQDSTSSITNSLSKALHCAGMTSIGLNGAPVAVVLPNGLNTKVPSNLYVVEGNTLSNAYKADYPLMTVSAIHSTTKDTDPAVIERKLNGLV